MTDLSAYPITVGTALFVSIDIENNPLRLSDEDQPRTINSVSYNNLGSLLAISNSHSNIRTSKHELTLTITGIPAGNITAAFDDEARGSSVTVLRGFVNPATGALIDTPAQKFSGIINHVTFRETWNPPNSTFDITFVCISKITQLQSRIAGRRTDPDDQARFFPSDTSFKRVTQIKNSNFNFGSPNPAPKYGTNL